MDLNKALPYLENILNSSIDGIVICDAYATIQAVNAAFLKMVGFQEAELKGKHIVELGAYEEGIYVSTTGDEVVIDAAYMDSRANKAVELFEKDFVKDWQTYFVKRDGQVVVPCDISMSVMKDDEGNPIGTLIIARDITERRRAENEIKRTKSYLEKIFSTNLDGVIVTDKNGIINMVNDAVINMVGYPQEELIGKHTSMLGWRRDGYEDRGRDLVEQLFEHGSVSGFEHVWQKKDGTLVDIELNVVLLEDEGGDISGSLSAVRDITERKRVGEELKAAKEAAETASQYKSNFLANMSHEIRTPMNAVIGFTDMLLDTPLDSEQDDYVRTVKNSTEALLALINDILDLSKIEAEKVAFEEIDFDLEILAYDVCELIRPRLTNKNTEILCRIDDNLPAMVKGDPNRFRQILVNLMGNAAKFTSEGEIELAMDVEGEEADRVIVHTVVRDTGIGIPQGKVESIFDTFQQADYTTTRKYGGTGLGLSICRQIAKFMGGNVWVESEPGKGSTFHFTAILKKPDQKKSRQLQPVSLAGKRVLVTDDSQASLNILVRLLESAGMHAVDFSKGLEAYKVLEYSLKTGSPFDICIFNVQMPDISGYDLAVRIRQELQYKQPMVAISTLMKKGESGRCREAGFNGFLPKPLNRMKLFRVMERLLSEAARSEKSTGDQTKISFVTQHTILEDSKQGLSILLAEDNPVNQKLAVVLLTKAGYQVDVAANGREAVDKFTAAPGRYDIILMDVQMPELNGYDATRAIRDWESKVNLQAGSVPDTGTTPVSALRIPIVAMTAEAMKGDREKCLDAGMDDYIPKPIKREVVFGVLKKWIFDRRSRAVENSSEAS